MKYLGTLCLLLALTQTSTQAQSADWWVAQGRDFLAARDLTNANNCFAAAVTNAPNHPAANVFYAATRLLTLADQPAGKAFLDRLGFATTNRSVYGWTAKVGHDTNGLPLAPANMSASELSAFLRTNILTELAGSASNLARVTDTNFTLALSSNETTTVAVTLDYGDLLLLRAGLEAAQYAGCTIHSWNLDVQLTTLRSLFTTESTSAQSFLAQYPNLFTFDTTNELSLAKQAFSNAVALYMGASDFIRSRPANVTRLFNYDAEMAGSEAHFRATLADLNESLSGPLVLNVPEGTPELTLEFGRQFTGESSPRSWFPQVAGNAIVAGTLPDPTFGGIIQGLPSWASEYCLGYGNPFGGGPSWDIPFVSRFRAPELLPDGRLQVTLDALTYKRFLVQASTDFQTWAPVAIGTAEAGVLSFTNAAAPAASQRFYRAMDVTEAFVATGTVLDVTTGNPVPNALVVVSFPYNQSLSPLTNHTDATGNYFFIDWQLSNYLSYQLSVSQPGYSPAQFNANYLGNSVLPVIYLAPPGYHPPNDNFSQRIALSGTNVTAAGFNVAATSEPSEPYPGFGQTVWWSWTAPANGALTIDASGSSFPNVVAVYTGNSVSSLTRIANNYYYPGSQNSESDFFVTAGTTYQIAVDSQSPGISGRIVLNLRSTPPRLPAITYQPQSQTVWAGDSAFFYTAVTGTGPLTCEWWKDGVSMAGANLPYYGTSNTQTNQAGAYCLVVTNLAGSATSAVVTLTVNWAPAPPNDMFANRSPITSLPATVTGSNAGASRESGEPYHGGYSGSKSVWWTWTAPGNGTITVDTIGTSFNNVLAIYTGNSLASLSAIASCYNWTGNTAGGVAFVATAGTTYQIAVDQANGSSGFVVLNLHSAQSSPPSILVQPQGQTNGLGTTVEFSVAASGSPPLAYQWRKDGTNLTNTAYISGVTTTNLTIANVQPADAGSYSVVVTNAWGSVGSSVAVLTVVSSEQTNLLARFLFNGDFLDSSGNNNVFDRTNAVLVDNAVYLNGVYEFSGPGVTNAYRATGYVPQLQFDSFTVSVDLHPDELRPYAPLLVGGASYRWIELTVRPGNALTLELNNHAITYPFPAASVVTNAWQRFTLVVDVPQGVIRVYQSGQKLGDASLPSGFELGPAATSEKTFMFEDYSDAAAYHGLADNLIVIGRAITDQEVWDFPWAYMEGVPNIVVQPASRTNVVGATAVFTVAAFGSGPLGYQWQRNGTNLVSGGDISGAVAANLALANVQLVDAADYTVVVSNAYGSVTSQVATLTVIALPGDYDYLITTNTYGPLSDWSLAVKQEFGPDAEVVDWNTLKSDFGGSVVAIRGLFDYLGILPYPVGDAPAVTWNGSQTWSGSRSYGVNRLEGVVPGGYLVHDQIQNYWACLGSWPADRRIIARVLLHTLPTIATEPQSQLNTVGSAAYLSVTATGTAPLAYQWRKSGTNLANTAYVSGVTTPNLTITNLQLTDTGGYSVVVTNDYGSVTSSVAVLTVTPDASRDVTYATNNGTITIMGYVGSDGAVTIPGTIAGLPVTSIGSYAFASCGSLTNITIPSSVTSIRIAAFFGCTNLTGVYFQGNAPSVGALVFSGANKAIVYYLPGTTGWGQWFGGRPTALWRPQVRTGDATLGVQTNQFGFTIAWASGRVIVVEACTNLTSPFWSPVKTNTLTDGSYYFSDPQRTTLPGRFYRLRSQ